MNTCDYCEYEGTPENVMTYKLPKHDKIITCCDNCFVCELNNEVTTKEKSTVSLDISNLSIDELKLGFKTASIQYVTNLTNFQQKMNKLTSLKQDILNNIQEVAESFQTLKNYQTAYQQATTEPTDMEKKHNINLVDDIEV